MDRRFYESVKTTAMGAFVIKNNGIYAMEFTGAIEDISECGMKIRVENGDYEQILKVLKDDSRISFQAFDDFNLFGNDVSSIFGGDVEVVRNEVIDGKLFIGCKIRQLSDSLRKYIDEKKMSVFIGRMRELNKE